MFNKLVPISILIMLLGNSFNVSAGLILETYDSDTATPTTIGGHSMTDFEFMNTTTGLLADRVNSPLGGSMEFVDRYGESVDMTQTTASFEDDWWVNGESFDYDIYTTSLNLITLILPEDTVAFSFNVGADLGSSDYNNAWLKATETNGIGIDTKYRFNVSESNTPGFGIYADNSNSSCSTISSVTIDPLLWGFGNFSISQGNCATVPEPSSLLLMSAGFMGIFGSLVARRKRKLVK